MAEVAMAELEKRKEITKELFGKDYFTIDAKRCALLVIDMQNSFVEEGAIFEAPKGREIIPSINRIVEKAREFGIPVIWTQSDHSPPGGGLILERYPVIKQSKELWLGDHSHQLYADMIQPVEGEHRIVKHKYDAFHDTDMNTVLKNMGKDTVIIVGVATEVCCESTARAAFFHEYKVVLLRDATGAFNPDLQDSTCDRINALFGRVMDTDEILTILDAGGEK
ncbi:MAG: cysteine hydrolase [Proteobacteria bacterium]|nr:cysteine hydrolase [Pseudomonadota bacterium]